jgi:hypothetical protein
MAMVRIFQVISHKFNIDRICPHISSSTNTTTTAAAATTTTTTTTTSNNSSSYNNNNNNNNNNNIPNLQLHVTKKLASADYVSSF